MKKLFVSILALAAFAACQSDFDDVTTNTPGFGEDVLPEGMIRTYAEVGVSEEGTKATYTGTKATWEAGDYIALLQENANLDADFTKVNTVPIKRGVGTNSATFSGDITVLTESPRIYHIAYPASAVSFSTSSSMALDGSVSYYESNNLWGYYTATGTYTYTYNSTLNITVPTTQSGKWEPYMYASTSEAVTSDAIGAKNLNTLTGAIAIRAFKADGVTPKQLKQITITSSSAAIAGAFSGTATSTGSTGSITGAKSEDGSTVVSSSSLKAEALANLESLAKTVVPTSTAATKAMSLSFAGSGKSITATDLDAIASEADGNYTYYINVAPATLAAGTLTIEATDVDGSTLKRVVDKEVVIAASHRAGFTLTWEDATLNGATIETWYHNWNTGSQFGVLEGNTIYVDNVSVEGNISADQVLAIGVRINGVFHGATQQSEVLSISPIKISGLSSGVYKVQPVAKVSLNGEEKWLECAEVEKTVTSIPKVIDYSVRTSYSSDGSVAKTNEINGDILRVKANISDSYVANNLVDGKTYTICYGSNTVTQTLGAEKDITLAYGAWGQYVCYVKIALANGYVCESTQYTTHVTGIPCSYDFYQGKADLDRIDKDGWKRNGTNGIQSNQFYIGQKTSQTGYVVSPKFHIPASFSTTTTLTHKCYSTSGTTVSYSAYSGAVASQTESVKTVTYSGDATVSTGETASLTTHKGDDKDVVLSSAKPYMCIGSTGCTGGLGRHHYIHKVLIQYRE